MEENPYQPPKSAGNPEPPSQLNPGSVMLAFFLALVALGMLSWIVAIVMRG